MMFKTAPLLFLIIGFISQAHALQPFAVREHRWQFEAGHRGFHTFGNYDDAGQYQPLPPGSYYQGLYGYGAATYDVTDFWTIGGGFDGGFTRSLNGATERTSLFLNNLRADTQLLWRNSFLWIAPQLVGVLPLVRNDFDTDTVMIGEGTVEQTFLLHGFKPWNRNFHSFAHVGFTRRDEGRSNVVPIGAGLRFRTRALWWGFLVETQRTINNDEFTSRAQLRNNVTKRVNAASYKYFSINPEWSRVEVFNEWAPMRQFATRAGMGLSFQGQNAPQEYYWMLSITYSFGGNVDDPKFIPLQRKEHEREMIIDERKKNFRPKSEGVDPMLFEDTAP